MTWMPGQSTPVLLLFAWLEVKNSPRPNAHMSYCPLEVDCVPPTDGLPPSWSSYMSSAASQDRVLHLIPLPTQTGNGISVVFFVFLMRLKPFHFALLVFRKMLKQWRWLITYFCLINISLTLPLWVFQCKFTGARFILHTFIRAASTPLCFPFPPAHKSLSYITGRQADALRCTATSQWAHGGRGRPRKGNGRETDGELYLFPEW